MKREVIIYSRSKEIGRAILRIGDESMGGVFGKFLPNENYEKIRKEVWEFNTADECDYEKWDSLLFEVYIEPDIAIFHVGGIMITDHPELLEEDIWLYIAGIDCGFLNKYFK